MTGIRAAVFCLGALGSFALAGCGSGSGPFEEKIYTPDGQIREIRVDVQDREIEISPSGDGRVHLQYSENNKEYYDISVNEEQVLEVTGKSAKEWTDYFGGKPSAENRKIWLQIPDQPLNALTLSLIHISGGDPAGEESPGGTVRENLRRKESWCEIWKN